jgi:glutaredoxin
MNVECVAGKKKADIVLYALSTCVWCKKTKQFLNDLGLAYSFVFVDLLPETEKESVVKDIEKWNPNCSFPTMVINGASCIVGYKPDEIKEKLGV